MREVVDRARELFLEGLPLAGMVDRRLALDLDLFSRGGLRVLDKIERQDYDVLRAPAGDLEDRARRAAAAVRWRGWRSRGRRDERRRRNRTNTAAAWRAARAKNFYYSFVLLSAASSATPCAPSTRSCATATT